MRPCETSIDEGGRQQPFGTTCRRSTPLPRHHSAIRCPPLSEGAKVSTIVSPTGGRLTKLTSGHTMLGIRLDRLTACRWFLASFLFASSAFGQVGMTQIRAGDVPITLVYPTAAVSSIRQLGPFTLQIAMSAVPSSGNGRLVVFSHGSGGDALTLHTLARTLALAGFVVAQPEHRGDNWQDHVDAGPTSWQRRPAEISRTIDAVASDPRFSSFLRLDRVGIYGVSAGGVTGLALAGGDWSIATLKRHCAVHVGDDAGFCLYGVRSAAEGVTRANSYTTPIEASANELLAGACVKDPRVVAVALSVPVAARCRAGLAGRACAR